MYMCLMHLSYVCGCVYVCLCECLVHTCACYMDAVCMRVSMCCSVMYMWAWVLNLVQRGFRLV